MFLLLKYTSWQAILYYMYTDYISFKPLGSQTIETTPAPHPSHTQFRGYQCSLREALYVAHQVWGSFTFSHSLFLDIIWVAHHL